MARTAALGEALAVAVKFNTSKLVPVGNRDNSFVKGGWGDCVVVDWSEGGAGTDYLMRRIPAVLDNNLNVAGGIGVC